MLRVSENDLKRLPLKGGTSQAARGSVERCLDCPHVLDEHLRAVVVRNGGGVEVGGCNSCDCPVMARRDFG